MTMENQQKKKLFLDESRIWTYGLRSMNQLMSLIMEYFLG